MKIKTRCIYLLLTVLTQSAALAGPVSELRKDESLIFFNTSAWLNQNTDQWHVPVHGWVYENEDSTFRKNLIAATLNTAYGLRASAKTQSNFDQRINWLLVDSESDKKIVIRLAGRTYAIPESKANGHFSTTLKISTKIFNEASVANRLKYQAVLPEQDTRKFNGEVHLIKPTGLSIISDIDDTIKISAVTNRTQLLNHTFFKDFESVPGMAALYQKILKNDGALHFVSSSPWQLYPELLGFISHAEYPSADYALKSFRFKDSSLMNLFASSLKTKPPQIKEIIKRYPGRQFILIGDSGEKDPEVYAQIQQKFPQQIIKIWIRNVTNEKADNARFQTLFKGLTNDQWQLFTMVNEIKEI